MYKVACCIFLLFIACFTLIICLPGDALIVITGTVVDSSSNRPISDVTIEITNGPDTDPVGMPLTIKTDRWGKFGLSHVFSRNSKSDIFILTAKRLNYTSTKININVLENEKHIIVSMKPLRNP